MTLACLGVFIGLPGQCQTWLKAFGETGVNRGIGMWPGKNGDLLVGAAMSQESNTADITLLGFDANGEFTWKQGYNDDYYHEIATILPKDSLFYILSATEGDIVGDFDFYLLAADSAGDTLFTRKYGTPADRARSGSPVAS